ncbi:unnamed protein product [Dicrocoelium dendriticum]|nr:unnamed protein product [Dicrocoelium dendriticum]
MCPLYMISKLLILLSHGTSGTLSDEEELCPTFVDGIGAVGITITGRDIGVLQLGSNASLVAEFEYSGVLSSAFAVATAVVTVPPYRFLIFDSRKDCRRLNTSECVMRREANYYLFRYQIPISSQWPMVCAWRPQFSATFELSSTDESEMYCRT